MTNKSPNAVVIDDNLYWLKTLNRLANHYGYNVWQAQSYNSALKLIEAGSPPDLIITDIRLKDNDPTNIDGILLLRELQKRKILKNCIIVTGYPTPETRKKAISLGAVYLEKGNFSIEDFTIALAAGKDESKKYDGLPKRLRIVFSPI